jgi:hypothetical protein
MNVRKIITIVLSIFIAASVIYLIATEMRGTTNSETAKTDISKPEDKDTPNGTALKKDHKVAIYYFHTTARCPTCRRIEELTAKATRKFFANEMADGKLVWKAVNIEETQNKHFVDDFKLFTKSVVVVDTEKGKRVRWKNLDRIWELVRNESAFTDYIKSEVTSYLRSI